MMHSESRSVLLTEFQEGSKETEILMELEEFLFSLKSQQQNYFKLLLLPNRENTNTANSSECCHTKYIHLYSTSSTTVPFKRVAAKNRRESGKSNAPCPPEWQNGTFMMSPRLFPEMDGLSWNTNWLIHRLTECAAAIPCSAVLSLDEAFSQTCWRGWLMSVATADTIHICLCMCDQDTCPVGRLDYIVDHEWHTVPGASWSSMVATRIWTSLWQWWPYDHVVTVAVTNHTFTANLFDHNTVTIIIM